MRERPLAFAEGVAFDDLYDTVLGARVAEELGHAVGAQIIIAHGAGPVNLHDHADKPFRVVGILAKTGTPVGRTVHVGVEAITAIHVDWQSGLPTPGQAVTAEATRDMDLTPRAITAFLVGVLSKMAIFGLQRVVNDYRREPLLAILPGVALRELCDMMGGADPDAVARRPRSPCRYAQPTALFPLGAQPARAKSNTAATAAATAALVRRVRRSPSSATASTPVSTKLSCAMGATTTASPWLNAMASAT